MCVLKIFVFFCRDIVISNRKRDIIIRSIWFPGVIVSHPIGKKKLINFFLAGAAGSKSRQKSSKYSKDDFLLDEPTAPPRVKRHASVTIPRNNGNTSEQVTSWGSNENNLSSDKNATTEVIKLFNRKDLKLKKKNDYYYYYYLAREKILLALSF